MSFGYSELYEILGFNNVAYNNSVCYASESIMNLSREKYLYLIYLNIEISNYLS